MTFNRDFRDLFAELNAEQVEYLVVGAHALGVYGHIRATKDLDVWIRAQDENGVRVFRALAKFGAPLDGVAPHDFSTLGTIFQIGIEPIRIDVINSIDGVEFEEAWKDRLTAQYADQPIYVISQHHLIQNKRASGRKQDLADLEQLDKIIGG